MVSPNDETQSQPGDAGWEPPMPGTETSPAGTAQADATGDGTGQDGSLTGSPQTGEQADGAKSQPRAYTEEEWAARESAKDKEVAGLRQMAVRLALDLQSQKAENTEAQFKAEDARAVENGDITEGEAAQRVRQRADDAKTVAERQAGLQGYQRLMAHGEEVGRLTAAEDFGREFGVDPKELLEDKVLTTPDAMRLKAQELALDKREAAVKEKEIGPETFDGGGGGGVSGGVNVDGLSPEEKITWALAHPPRKR